MVVSSNVKVIQIDSIISARLSDCWPVLHYRLLEEKECFLTVQMLELGINRQSRKKILLK